MQSLAFSILRNYTRGVDTDAPGGCVTNNQPAAGSACERDANYESEQNDELTQLTVAEACLIDETLGDRHVRKRPTASMASDIVFSFPTTTVLLC